MSKHSKSRLKEMFVGSATAYVSHHIQCPLLVMHCD
jgi:nucleotide-binding universal stress UspA family protein